MEVVRPVSSGYDGVDAAPNKQENGNTLTWVNDTSHKFINDGKVILRVKTGSGANQTMTVESQAERFGLPLEDRVVDLDANSTQIFPPFPAGAHNEPPDATDAGYTSVKFSRAAGLEVTAIGL